MLQAPDDAAGLTLGEQARAFGLAKAIENFNSLSWGPQYFSIRIAPQQDIIG
ncbi:MAG: hypothetical protein ACLQVY_16480 [Limisphaerales bacterium]